MRALAPITMVLLGVPALLGGCTKNCQNTCEKIYGAECDIRIPGIDNNELQDTCKTECEDALHKAGEMGSYNPYNQRDPNVDFHLENEKQAAEWMDCVEKATCEDLDPVSGICYPI